MSRIVITGDKQIDRALVKLEKKSIKKILRQALRKAAKEMLSEVIAQTPKESGELAGNIKVKAGKRSTKQISMEVQISNEDFKASAQEYGTEKQEPTPFIRPAFDASAPSIKDQALKFIKDGIEAAANKSSKSK